MKYEQQNTYYVVAFRSLVLITNFMKQLHLSIAKIKSMEIVLNINMELINT